MKQIALILLSVMLSACASNKAEITHSWVNEDIHNKDLQGVLVVAIAQKAEARQRFEHNFTQALKKHGVRAIASYTLIGGTKIDKEDIIALGKQQNVDTVLVTSFAGRDQHEVMHPGRTYYGVQPIYNRGYYGRGGVYGRVYEVGHTPDFYAVHKSLHLEANLYAIATEEHLWLAASGVTDDNNRQEMANAFIQAFIKQLSEQNLIQ
jgi:hypothetical protein